MTLHYFPTSEDQDSFCRCGDLQVKNVKNTFIVDVPEQKCEHEWNERLTVGRWKE